MASKKKETGPLGALLAAAKSAGWTVETRDSRTPAFDTAFRQRYPRLVPGHVEFLKSVSVCMNAEKTTWFLCESDYETKGTSADGFRWNEYETMSLETAKDDASWQQKIRKFWDSHLPILLSVKAGDYDYVAVDLSKRAFGTVVHGVSPEFEEVSTLSTTFEDFLKAFTDALRGREPPAELSPLKLLV